MTCGGVVGEYVHMLNPKTEASIRKFYFIFYIISNESSNNVDS